jgi:hypothetical protein
MLRAQDHPAAADSNLTVITFGAPRMQGAAPLGDFSNVGARMVGDLVPLLPPKATGFSGFGNEFLIDNEGVVYEVDGSDGSMAVACSKHFVLARMLKTKTPGSDHWWAESCCSGN